MKKIKFHQLQQSNRLIIESIRLQLKSQQIGFKRRGRFMTLPDQHSQQIFRSKKQKRQLSSLKMLEPLNQKYSIPLKLNRWQTIQEQEMKRIKSNIQEKKQHQIKDPSFQQIHKNKQVGTIGSLIFVKEMFPESSTKSAKQKRKITNLLKFKSFKGINPIKIAKSKQFLSNNLAVSPMKISLDLPKLKSKDTQVLRYINKNDLQNPYKQAQRSLLLNKGEIRKFQKLKQNDLSPWSTKGQICNLSEPLKDVII